MTKPLSYPKFQALDSNGDPLSGGLVYTYKPGTTTNKTTYSDYNLATPNANPVVLDSRGEADIFLDGTTKLLLKTSAGTTVWTLDNVENFNKLSMGYFLSDYDDLDSAITAIGATETELIIDEDSTIADGDSVTIPATLTLNFINGSIIDGTAGGATETLTVNGGIKAANQQIFGANLTLAGTPKLDYAMIKWCGATGDGVTNDSTALQAAINFANLAGVAVHLDGDTYANTSQITAPSGGFLGSATFTGDVLFSTAQYYTSNHDFLYADNITVDDVEHGTFGPMKATTMMTIGGSTGGTFWCTFERLVGPLTIDVSSYACNQNLFRNVRTSGGITISGDGTNACDANHFVNVDTTTSNLTGPDLVTGYHIVDENGNGDNVIQQWYAETSGKMSLYGNFDVLGARQTYAGSVHAAPPHRHHLFASSASSNNGRNNGDYLALTGNMVQGGEWELLDCTQSNPRPPSFYHSGAGTPDIAADANEPSGLGYYWGKTSSGATAHIGFLVDQYNGGKIACAFYLYAPDGIDSIIVDRGTAGNQTYTTNAMYDCGNDWYFVKIFSNCSADGSAIGVKVMFNTGESVSRTIGISTVFASNFRTARQPVACPEYFRKGISTDGTVNDSSLLPIGAIIENKNQSIDGITTTLWIKKLYGIVKLTTEYNSDSAAPTTGTWDKGAIIYDTAPAASGTIGWVCTSAGTFSAATDATGDTDGSTGVITGMADTSDFTAGDYITTSAGFPNSVDDGNVPVKILSVDSATQITIDDTSDSSETDITVLTPDPVFKTWGAISA